MKKLYKIVAIICILFSLTGCFNKEKSLKDYSGDAIKFKKEYESLNGSIRGSDGKTIRPIEIDEDNPIVYSNPYDIIERIDKKETFVVFFGFNDCPWCRSVINPLIKASKDLKVDKILYVDIKNIRDEYTLNSKNNPIKTKEGTPEYYELLEAFREVLSDYNLNTKKGKVVSVKEKRIYSPNVISVVNGKAKNMVNGISPKQNDAYQELNETILEESYDIFKCALECVNEKNVCQEAC